MIVPPDWTTLRQIANGLDDPDPIARKRAIENTLNTIAESLPDVQAVRVYDLQNQALIVRAATDLNDKSAQPLSAYPGLNAMLDADGSQWEPEQRRWLCPLAAAGEAFGLFEVLVDDLDTDWIVWLEAIAAQIGPKMALHRVAQRDNTPTNQTQVRQLVEAIRMLAASEDYDNTALAAMHAAPDDTTAVMITLFDVPFTTEDTGMEGITNNRRHVVALADATHARLISRGDSLSPMPELSFIDDLRREVPIQLQDLQTEAGYLNGWMRQQAAEYQAQQVVTFGLVAAERIVGTLDLFFKAIRPLTQEELDLHVTLASQLSATILSKRLLQQSLAAQAFASQLVSTNKSLAIAESYDEMAQAVLKDAPKSVQAVAIALFNRPFTLMGSPVSLRTRAAINRQGETTEGHIDHFSVSEDARVTYFLHEFLEGSMMLLWSRHRSRTPVMAESLVNYLIADDVEQVTAFGLNVRKSLRGLVLFAGDDTLRDPGPQYDGLRAISDQLAAVIENRILLQQTSEALDLIQSQYETSSRVFRTGDLSEILRAICDFAGGVFDRAELVSTDALGAVRMRAEVAEDTHYLVDQVVRFADYPASDTLIMLEALEVRDIEDDVFIDAEERERLRERGVRSLVILPILVNQELNGLMMLTSGQPNRIAPDRLRAMRSLADQVGVVLQNRNLLQNVEINLNEIQVLYEANRAMLRTQDIMDVLRVLRTNLAPDAAAICQIGIQYDNRDRNRITDVVLEYEITREAERVLHQTLNLDKRDGDNVYNFLRGLQDAVLFSPQGVAVPGNPISLTQGRYAIESFATLLVKERGQVVSLVYLLFDQHKPFLEGTRRLYEAISDQVGIAIDNQKLLRTSQAAAARLGDQVSALQTISSLAVELSTIRDEQVLLDTSALALVESIGADHCGIVLFNNDDSLTGVVVAEYPESGYIGVTVPVDTNPILQPGHNHNRAIVIEDLERSDVIGGDLKQLFLDGNIRSLMIIPLVGSNGELIGSVGLDVYDQPRQFEKTEVQTAQTIAAQMAVGLQNVRLLREAQARAEQLQHINDFSSVTQSSLDPNQLIEATLANMPRLMDVKHITLALYTEGQEALVLAGGWHEEKNGFRTTLPLGEQVPLEGTTTGYVYETGETLYIPVFKRGESLHYPHDRAIRSLLSVPLRNQGRIIGVATVGSFEERAYTPTDVAVFQQLVNHIAVAMDNARTYTRSQQVARNKSLANDLALQLQREGDIQKMIDLTMQEVGRAIGAKRGRLRLKPSTQQPEKPPSDPEQRT